MDKELWGCGVGGMGCGNPHESNGVHSAQAIVPTGKSSCAKRRWAVAIYWCLEVLPRSDRPMTKWFAPYAISHPPIPSFIDSSMDSFIVPSFCINFPSLFCLIIVAASPLHPPLHPQIECYPSLIPPSILPWSLTDGEILSLIHALIHSFVHSLIHSLVHYWSIQRFIHWFNKATLGLIPKVKHAFKTL